jgi:hypothetical protein
MEVFAVIDQAFFGRGVYAVFSSLRMAEEHKQAVEAEHGSLCTVRACTVIAAEGPTDTLYAGYSYNGIYDVLIFDAIYAEAPHARDAVGHRGLVVRLIIDMPGHRETVPPE